jgi:hypothetical protein
MLCGETVAVYCENRTEHTDTLWAVRTSQETHRYTVWEVHTSQGTHHVSTTELYRLMLCGETVTACCENRTEHTDTVRTSQETEMHCISRMQSFGMLKKTACTGCLRCTWPMSH